MPHFVVGYKNTGNVPVIFADFELLLPRHDVIQDGQFVGHLGADLYIDKRLSSRAGALQHISKIDNRTNKVRLDPGEFHTDYFDLGAFLPDFDPGKRGPQPIPEGFDPVLRFEDSWGNEIVCDRQGLREGPWEHRDMKKLKELGYETAPATKLTARRVAFTRRWRLRIADQQHKEEPPPREEVRAGNP